nr:hypothetical protein [Tanacetum cinerariifolium]
IVKHVFADVMSARIAKGMCEGFKYRVEHGKANLDLEAIEAYDLEADTKYVTALHALMDLKYPMVDQLESLKDASIDVIMASLHLETSVHSSGSSYRRRKLKAAFKEFKKYEDDRVEKHCAKMDARLDALSIDFNEELYPHMLTTIAGRRWVIGHGLRLAVMKCGESTKVKHVFADVMSARIAKGMCEGFKYGVEHGKANLDLEAIEAYDLEADTKYVAALHALMD